MRLKKEFLWHLYQKLNYKIYLEECHEGKKNFINAANYVHADACLSRNSIRIKRIGSGTHGRSARGYICRKPGS